MFFLFWSCQQGSMVIEYIGSIIRNEVANRREQIYEKQVGNVCAKTFLIAMFVSGSFCHQDFMVVAQLVNLKREFMENSVKKLAKKKQKNQAFNEYLYIWYRQA